MLRSNNKKILDFSFDVASFSLLVQLCHMPKDSEVSFGEKRLRSKKWLYLGYLGMLCSKKFVYNFQSVCSSLFQMTMPSYKNYKPHFNTSSKQYAYSFFCFASPPDYCFQICVLLYVGE